MLDRVDVHCIWVSKAVLGLLPADMPAIPGGEIINDPGRGVFCDKAMDKVMEYWPRPNKGELTSFVKTAMKELNGVGLVGVHDAGVIPSHIGLFSELAGTDDWTVRVYAMLECAERNTFCATDASELKSSRDDGRLSVKSVKLFGDGALGSWGSAMLHPYSDRPESIGSLLINGSELSAVTKSWAKAGFQVNIHAIGDLANRLAIDAFEAALSTSCLGQTAVQCQSELRFRIEHAQIIHPDDQKRMFKLGIIPSIQPTHATSDMTYAEARLGPERTTTEAYRLRSVLPLNPVLGSDFPVEPSNPFHGMYAAVTRKNPKTGSGKGGSDEGWHLEEALTMNEALVGFTINAAHGAFLEGKAGSIQQGTYADWVVLDKPWDQISADDLLDLKVSETWVGGKLVYKRDEEAPLKLET
jgi:predicted amidohydrolase YtcJ